MKEDESMFATVSDGIAKKMKEVGIVPIAFFWVHDANSIYVNKKELLLGDYEPMKSDTNEGMIVPAFNANQLYAFLQRYKAIEYDETLYLLWGDVDFFGEYPEITIYYKAGSEMLGGSLFIGKLTDPIIPSAMLELLNKMGLL